MVRDFERLAQEADAVGIRLEVVQGITLWEPPPVYRHQAAIDRIRASIRPIMADASCVCIHAADVQVRFSDDSHKRPDISIFCRELDEQDRAITLMPEAVIEVLSKDYEAKDLVIGVPFYRQIGVKDVIVLDPETNEVKHWQQGQPERTFTSPVTLSLLCGCTCTV